MKTHCQIELPHIEDIIKILNNKLIINEDSPWQFDMSQSEKLMDVDVLWEDLKELGITKNHFNYSAVVVSKSFFGPHKDVLTPMVALNIPIRNCENTDLVFYKDKLNSIGVTEATKENATYVVYNNGLLIEFDRVRYVNKAIAFRTDVIHDIVGASDDKPRATLTMRFHNITFGLI